MNIQSGTYYWPDTFRNKPTYPALKEDITCDVLIVGGGSSGAQCAYYLADQGLDVVVLEGGEIGLGSTSTNTCLLQSSGEKLFTDLVHVFGDDYVTRHLQLCQEAIDEIEKACSQMEFDAEFQRRETLYYVSQDTDLLPLQRECEWLQERGTPIRWVTEEWISQHYSFTKQGGIFSKNDGEMNPFIFTHGLLHYAFSKGVRVFEHTKMTGEHYVKEEPVISTNRGHQVRAKQVIYAAGYQDMEIKKEKKARFVSTYTVTTNPIEHFSGWYDRTLIWETARPYVFIRTTKDNRIIIGGLDEETENPEERDGKLVHKRKQLMEELNKLFPNIHASPAYYSAAFYGGVVDGLPMIGEYKEHPNSFFLLGYGDNGTVYSMLLAKILKEWIVDGKKDDYQLYQTNRPLKKKKLYK
ncbi:NAD(P)/FAD-dependent oxidoreductase [Halobacillus sp. K22]|uniref:NAD(P)/FAD-dependent oxidoreductase n=1 Tax=Halobacillus sp. K22 TaxID=3457431 RepID=UPI003FCDEA8C